MSGDKTEPKEEKEKSGEDLELPRAVVQRLIKYSLPDNVHVQQEAKLAIAHAGKVFINYLTACANDYCIQGTRSTISAKDVLNACDELEMPEITKKLKEVLEAYKKEQSEKKEKGKDKEKDEGKSED
eukprot:Phypoly_transcript_27931.p1 GENE.Phypoly_transcript_27931~~Phypoly_transcript_27931.p1  ORF type:complete len:127 (+),score=31.42 Phypoly_transcript_27931:85-465(+)